MHELYLNLHLFVYSLLTVLLSFSGRPEVIQGGPKVIHSRPEVKQGFLEVIQGRPEVKQGRPEMI